ncbi:acylphosphatase [Pararhizobium polonicum]|uniref:acylphosphatase n=1 Tax=Pararhizobium polonicum TaxID=1612624 RepID=UPI0026D16BAA
MTDDRKALLVRITGRVQGVGFRFWTRGQAERLSLSGWVRNEDDGSVKALIAGPDRAVSAMLQLLRNGPPGALVSSVETASTSLGEVSPGFRITK